MRPSTFASNELRVPYRTLVRSTTSFQQAFGTTKKHHIKSTNFAPPKNITSNSKDCLNSITLRHGSVPIHSPLIFPLVLPPHLRAASTVWMHFGKVSSSWNHIVDSLMVGLDRFERRSPVFREPLYCVFSGIHYLVSPTM